MIYPIILYGDSVLREKCSNIIKGEIDTKILSDDMFETMSHADGIGLAAPQIGIPKRMFVVDGSSLDDKDLSSFKKVFINPKIEDQHGDEWEFEEGCLSIPGVRGVVLRKPNITISYFDENWISRKESFTGMKARVIQHEYDHIEGKLFVDYLSSLKRNRMIKKVQKFLKTKK